MKRAAIGCFAVVGGLVVLLIVIAIIAAAVGTKGTSSSSPPATAKPDNKQPVTHPVATKATKATKALTLLDVSGTGTHTTQKFTTGGSDWDLQWSYSCAGTTFGSGNFIVNVYEGGGSTSLNNSGVNELGKGGSGTEHFHTGGTFYLSVIGDCPWHMKAIG